MTELEKLIKLTDETDEDLLKLLLEDAEEFVISYTNRSEMTEKLRKPVRDLAVIAYNRMGTQGENRLARVGGKVYEAET